MSTTYNIVLYPSSFSPLDLYEIYYQTFATLLPYCLTTFWLPYTYISLTAERSVT